QLYSQAESLTGKAAMAEADAIMRRRAAAEAGRRKAAAERERLDLEWAKAGWGAVNPQTGKRDRLPPSEEDQLKVAQARATLAKTQGEAAGATGGPGGNPFAIGDAEGNPYKNRDGAIFTVKDDTRRMRVNELNVAAHNIRRMADLVQLMKEDE